MPDYFDIHTHVNFKAFDEDREEVIERSLKNNTWMINIGTQLNTSKEAVKLAEKYKEGVYASIGLHPVHTIKTEIEEEESSFVSREEIFEEKDYKDLIKSDKVLAIGECGLDYFRIDKSTKEKQIESFEKQIEFAIKYNKPLMIHCRDAYDDLLDILNSKKKEYGDKLVGNIHFFAGDVNVAKRFLNIDFTLSFTGVITFTNDYDEVIKYVSIDKIMSETDAPYVTPTPFRGKRNEPLYVEYVVRRIALIKNLDFSETKSKLVDNSLNFFKIT